MHYYLSYQIVAENIYATTERWHGAAFEIPLTFSFHLHMKILFPPDHF